jgi:hypothetical protein
VLSDREQIDAILGNYPDRWAQAQLKPGETMDDKRYHDLIRVTQDDIYRYVQAHGFPRLTVYEEGSPNAIQGDDQLWIVRSGDRWEVSYVERGNKNAQSQCDMLEEARREVIRRKMRSARITLNHRYRNAHPELNLPPPDEMD